MSIRDPSFQQFTALPAAACLLDPSVASVLMTEDMKPLLEAAIEFIVSQVLNFNSRKLDNQQRHCCWF